jgi:hypothetical protein
LRCATSHRLVIASRPPDQRGRRSEHARARVLPESDCMVPACGVILLCHWPRQYRR